MRQESGIQTTCQESLKGVSTWDTWDTWHPLETWQEERKVGGGDST